MNESTRSCTSGRLDAVALAAFPSLRPLIRSNEDTCGEVGDCSGEDSGDEEAEREVLSFVVSVRKMGILRFWCCGRVVLSCCVGALVSGRW